MLIHQSMLAYLSVQDIALLSLCNKHIFAICDRDSTWEMIFKRDYRECYVTSYKMRYKIEKDVDEYLSDRTIPYHFGCSRRRSLYVAHETKIDELIADYHSDREMILGMCKDERIILGDMLQIYAGIDSKLQCDEEIVTELINSDIRITFDNLHSDMRKNANVAIILVTREWSEIKKVDKSLLQDQSFVSTVLSKVDKADRSKIMPYLSKQPIVESERLSVKNEGGCKIVLSSGNRKGKYCGKVSYYIANGIAVCASHRHKV